MDINLMVAIGGSAIGLLGAAIGTYFSIKSTRTPAERRFVVKVSIGVWVVGTLLMGLPLVLALAGIIQRWVFWAMFPLYFILLGLTMRWANRRQASFRKEVK
jgi:Ca2+/Na+ antiporter